MIQKNHAEELYFILYDKSLPLFEFECNDAHRRHLDSELAF